MGEACSFAVTPTPLDIDGNIFPAFVSPPQSSKPPLFLAGAGVRGLDIGGQFVKFSAIGVYLEHSAIETLSRKWSGKTPDELATSLEFYSDIFNGPFEKFVRVTLIRHLTGEQYTGKVIENCIAIWKGYGIFTQEQVDAANKLKEVFKPEDFPPGTSILFTHSPSGALSIAFSEDSSVPETNKAVIVS